MVWEHDFRDWGGLPMCTPESAHHAVDMIGLIFQERQLLAKHGVDWRLYDSYELD